MKKNSIVSMELTLEQQVDEERRVVQSAMDAAAFARAALQNVEYAKNDGAGNDSTLIALAEEAMAAAELLEERATRLAAMLRKAFAARCKAAA